MLEGLSNITTQTCCQAQKLNKLDYIKNLSIFKRVIGIKSDKYASMLEIKKVWKQVKDGVQ